jgi:hypothetical protein
MVQNRRQYSVGFEVLMAVSTKMAVFWVVAPCSLVEVYRRFRGPCCLHRCQYSGLNLGLEISYVTGFMCGFLSFSRNILEEFNITCV